MQGRPGNCHGAKAPGRAGTLYGTAWRREEGLGRWNRVQNRPWPQLLQTQLQGTRESGVRQESWGEAAITLGPESTGLVASILECAANQPSLGSASFQGGPILWMGRDTGKVKGQQQHGSGAQSIACRNPVGSGGHKGQGKGLPRIGWCAGAPVVLEMLESECLCPPRIRVLKPNPQCDGFGRRGPGK